MKDLAPYHPPHVRPSSGALVGAVCGLVWAVLAVWVLP